MPGDNSEDRPVTRTAFAVETALTASTCMTVIAMISTALNHSAIRRTVAVLGQFGRSSTLYQWATETPDEISVDLNDAIFGIPIAKIVYFAGETYPRARRSSSAVKYYRTLEVAVRSAPLRLLGTGLLIVGVLGTASSLATESTTVRRLLSFIMLAGIGVLISRIRTSWAALSDATVVKLWKRNRSRKE